MHLCRPAVLIALGVSTALLCACGAPVSPEQREQGIAAFATIQEVFQHPRCANCHIPGEQPLQSDDNTPHLMGVVRGPEGHGAEGLPCATCHGEANLAAAYGANAPPGAPHWGLPPPEQKMAWIDLPAAQVCAMIKDPAQNGDRDLAAVFEHVSEDKLVLWGWDPGGDREPVPVPHAQFVAQFRQWMDAGAPCPES